MLRLGAQICEKWLCTNALRTHTTVFVKSETFLPRTTQIVRKISFFNTVDSEALWKGVTSVSNAGKKRGRGRGGDKRIKKNLNRGQKIGTGKQKMVWPGLSCSVIQGNTMIDIQKLPDSKTDDKSIQDSPFKRRKFQVHPLERGWTARAVKGKSIGPPDPVGDATYESFNSVPIEHGITLSMTSIFGKKRWYATTVLTGNGNGLIGMGRAKCLDPKSALRLAKNRAIKRLVVIDLIDKTSVNHDFYSSFGNTRIFVYKKPDGYGLVCQRVIKVCCELLGIKNLTAKIEGSINYKHIYKAFILGLLRQKTYQQIADEKKLHLVEFRKERMYFPEVLASPQVCLTPTEARKDPIGFEEFIMGNRVIYRKPKKGPFYQRLPSWSTYLKRTLYKRNHDKVKQKLLAEYGDYRSFLTDMYPECRSPFYNKKKENV